MTLKFIHMKRKKSTVNFYLDLDLLMIYLFNYKNPSGYNIKSIL